LVNVPRAQAAECTDVRQHEQFIVYGEILMRATVILLSGVAVLTMGMLCRVSAQASNTGRIELEIVPAEDQAVTMSLYLNGKLLATKEIAPKKSAAASVIVLSQLPYGTYEARFEAPEYVTVVKRVVLRQGDNDQKLTTKLTKGKGSLVLGGGASIEELEERIKKLEAEVAKLQNK
jgi:hypothetical protein